MLKGLVKTGMATALHWSGADRMIGAAPRVRSLPLVLAYHSVVDDVRRHIGRAQIQNLVSTAMFERQLDWVGRRYQFVSLDEIGRRIKARAVGGRPIAAVTFDDGYVGVYQQAFPLLQRKGIPAGIFLVTETVGRPHLHLYDKLYLLLQHALPALRHSRERFKMLLETKDVDAGPVNRVPPLDDPFVVMRWLFTGLTQHKLRRTIEALETVAHIEDGAYPDLQSLTWEMVHTLAGAGWTVGSHTQTHPLLTEESPRRVINQAVGSLRTLQEKLGRPVEHFAYPDGRYNPAVVSAVAHAGYRFAYGTCLHRDPRYPQLTIPRKLMWERTSLNAAGAFSASVMSCHVHRVFDLWSACGHNHEPKPASAVRPSEAMGHGADITARSSGVTDRLHV